LLIWVYTGFMGFWRKLGEIAGRMAVTAAAGAVQAKASGKPITIGTVGPGVLGDVLQSSGVTPAVERRSGLPAPVVEGSIAVAFEVVGVDRERLTRVRYFTDMEMARKFADAMGAEVIRSVDTGEGLAWVPVGKSIS
jgi:hypothetical protein